MTSDSEHVDLVGLLSGELPPAQRAVTVSHVRGCEQCLSQLAETAAMVGELKDAGRHSPVDPSEVPPLDLAALKTLAPPPGPSIAARDEHDPAVPVTHTRRPLIGRLGALGIAASLIVALVGGVVIGHSLQPSKHPAAEVRLAAVGEPPTPAAGAARMLGSGEDQTMQVTLSGLALPSPDDSVEVWLLNTRNGQTRAIGTMPATNDHVMTATFPLPASDLAGFDAVDVSIQSPADHGQHSANSVLRGAVA